MSEPSSSSKDDNIYIRRHLFANRNDEKASTNDEEMYSAWKTAIGQAAMGSGDRLGSETQDLTEFLKIFDRYAKTDEDFSKESVMSAVYLTIKTIPTYKFNPSTLSFREEVAAAMASDPSQFVEYMIKNFSIAQMDDFLLKLINLRATEWKKPEDDSSAVAKCLSQATASNQEESREKRKVLASILIRLKSEQGNLIYDPEFLRTTSSSQLNFFEQLERCSTLGKSPVQYALNVYSLEELKELDEKISSFQRSMDSLPVCKNVASSHDLYTGVGRAALLNHPTVNQEKLIGFSATVKKSSAEDDDQKRLMTPEERDKSARNIRILHGIYNDLPFRHCSDEVIVTLIKLAKQCDKKEFETFMSQNYPHKEIVDIISRTKQVYIDQRMDTHHKAQKWGEPRKEMCEVLASQNLKASSINKTTFSPHVQQKFDKMFAPTYENFKIKDRESLIWNQYLPHKESLASSSDEPVETRENFEAKEQRSTVHIVLELILRLNVSSDHFASYPLFDEMERKVIKLLEICPYVTSDVLTFTQKWFRSGDLVRFYKKLIVYEKHREFQERTQTQKQPATVEATARPSEHLTTSTIKMENDEKHTLLDSILVKLKSLKKKKLTREKFHSLLTRKESDIYSVIIKFHREGLKSQILCFSKIELKEFDTKLQLIMKLSDAENSESTRLALQESILKKLIRSSIMAPSTPIDSVPVITDKEKTVIDFFEFALKPFSDEELKSFDAKVGVAEITTKKYVSVASLRRLDAFSTALDKTQQEEGEQEQSNRNRDTIPSALLANLSLNESSNKHEQSAALTTSFSEVNSTKNVAKKNFPPKYTTRYCTYAHLLNRPASQYVSPSSRLVNPESILSDCGEPTEGNASTSSVSAVERESLGKYGFEFEPILGCSNTQHPADRRSALTPVACAQVEEILLRNTKHRLNDVPFDQYASRTPDEVMPSCTVSQKDINEYQKKCSSSVEKKENKQKSPINLLKSETPPSESSSPLPESIHGYSSDSD